MWVLVVNAGSSSLKLRVLGDDDEVEAEHDIERWNVEDEATELAGLVGTLPAFQAVGHRVVHGGRQFREAVRIDAGTERALLALSSLAPLHQPRAVAGIALLRRLYPDLPQVACFDTAFHATMASAASTYALPNAWRLQWGLERFGFHGLSHAYATRHAAQLAGQLDNPRLRTVSCHLGAGASLCATRGGHSVDTTMGFTPLEGLVMATRSGTVDPGLVLWLIQHAGLTVETVAQTLESDAGLAGLSDIAGGDMRDVLAARAVGDAQSILAFDVYAHRLRRELGGMVATLGGLDLLVFTGGVGEHAHEVRAAACRDFDFVGVRLDAARNTALLGEGEISSADSSVRTFVVAAREDVEIARQVRAVLGPSS